MLPHCCLFVCSMYKGEGLFLLVSASHDHPHAPFTPYLLCRALLQSENFQFTLDKTSGCKEVPFDFDSNFIKMYFGPKKSGFLDYFAFVQLLQVISG